MFLDELCVPNIPRLTEDHPVFWMESVVRIYLKQKPVHDAEHLDMMEHFTGERKEPLRLTLRKNKEGEVYSDRLYHVALHLKFWKDKGIRLEHVEKFEKLHGNLDLVPLPDLNEKIEGVEADY